MQKSRYRPAFQITQVRARNFRSIANAKVELEGLTVLVGPNASGKSNILDVLRFIKDALRLNLESAISRRHGAAAIRHLGADSHPAEIELGLQARGRLQEPEGKQWDEYSLDYCFTLEIESNGHFQVKKEYARVWSASMSEAVEFKVERGRLTHPQELVASDGHRGASSGEETGDVDMSDLWLPKLAQSLWMWVRPGTEGMEHVLRQASWTLHLFHRDMKDTRFYHLFPNTVREPQKYGNAYVLDEDAGNLAPVLQFMQLSGSEWASRFRDSLQNLIPGVSDLSVTDAGQYLLIRLKHSAIQEEAWIDLAQESDGTIRLLCLLTALYQMSQLPLLGVEEPELTVHPGTLSVLADLLKEAARRSQVIVTTHSPDLIDCLTDSREIDGLRIVELREGATVVGSVACSQKEAVRQSLFSPGELHSMGELELPHGDAQE